MNIEFIRFAFVGAIGFLADGGGTWLLAHLGVPPLAARIPPLLTSILVTWLLNRTMTFRVEAPRSRAEMARYFAVALSSALMNYLLYSALVLAGLHPLPSVALATVVLMGYSFFAYRRMVFR